MIDFLLAISILASARHPHLYSTTADVARARFNAQKYEWAKAYFTAAQVEADKWAAMNDAQLRALIPPAGSIYAYGLSGCPICGANWPVWGANGIADISKPGLVICPKCRHVFPDAEHPDPGTGWHNPENGRDYYFIGVYNAHVAQMVTLHALRDLSTCYAITGDRKYSRAAASLFDQLADVYPTSIVGAFDYPNGDHNTGRLERPQYQVARVLVLLADDLDLLYDSPDFSAPSASGKGSVREYVEQNIIADGGKYCYDFVNTGKMALTNGQADYVRGALAAGIILDKKEWIDCALTGPYRLESFIDNCLDRDGQYYETSVGYSDHCLSLYTDMAEMLYNLRTPEHPNGINYYEHPKLQKALFKAGIDINCMGHTPRFGDWGPDTAAVTSDKHFSLCPYVFSEMLEARAADKAGRVKWAAARSYICDGEVEARRSDKALGDFRHWFFWHADKIEEHSGPMPKFDPQPILGGRGVAVLRSGEGSKGKAALLRYGPSLNHSHFDDLNLNFFDLGRELTYDLGYALGSAHVQVGWSKTTASHNLVVVNEKNQLTEPGSGGSAYFYVEKGPVRAVEASSEASYVSEGVKTYRRTLALIDAGKGSYLVDIFRVAGGNQHDLMWHFGGTLAGINGADMGNVEPGSLAGPDIEWGTKVIAGGDLAGCADKGTYWAAPPGNGYGFLYNVRRSTSISPECTATWKVDDKQDTVSLHMLPEPGAQIITAKAPGIELSLPKPEYAIVRRKGHNLKSAFVSVVEASENGGAVRSVKRMECDADEAVGVEIETMDGTDYVLSSTKAEPVVFKTASGEAIRFNGLFGFLRERDEKIERGVLTGGTELSMASYKLTSDKAQYMAKVMAVDLKQAQLTLDKELPTDFMGQIVYINRGDYSHNSPYYIKSVNGKNLALAEDLVLSRGQIGTEKPVSADTIMNIVPLPRARIVSWKPSGYFRGKLIVNNRTGASSSIIDVNDDYLSIRVHNPGAFKPGDGFTIYDVQVGDEVKIPVSVSD